MTIYIDENMPPSLAKGFNILQYPENYRLSLTEHIFVESIKEKFGTGIKDEDWIPQVGKENGCIITQDYNLNRIKSQRELCRVYRLGMFYLRPTSKKGFSYWEMVQLLVKHWPGIVQVCINSNRPFMYEIRPRSKKLIQL